MGGSLVLMAVPPGIAVASTAPSLRPAPYFLNGVTCVVVITAVLALYPFDVDEPVFSRHVAAALHGAAMFPGIGARVIAGDVVSKGSRE